jgi:hypothetical protein
MKLWNKTTDDNSPERKQVREQKRRLNYIANILVVNDPKHPENNGKVFLYKFGKKIFDKIMDKARPAFEDEDPVNVFDYWDGANFKLRMRTVDGYPNYDSSEFEARTPVARTDEGILEIANKQYDLSEFVDPKNFKSYAELKTKLETVLNGSTMTETAYQTASSEDDSHQVMAAPAPGPVRSAPKPVSKQLVTTADDDDDMMSYFQSIADDA